MRADKAIFIISSTALLAAFASAKTITVGSGPHSNYSTIQAAINAAHAGDQIEVSSGTYAEQLTIGTGKNNLSLSTGNAVIAPAATMTSGFMVTINGAQNVTLQGFTLSGPIPDAAFFASPDSGGILVEEGGSANIVGNTITQIWQATVSDRGIQNGIAIEVGNSTVPTSGSASIVNNTIEHWQKGAIVIDGAGSKSQIYGNLLIGEGPINYTAQNGIQVGDSATASIFSNNIGDLSYTPATYYASGILVFDTSNVSIFGNKITDCDLGVAFADVTKSNIDLNQISGGQYGLDIDEFSTGSKNNEIGLNESTNNAEEGVYVSVDSVKNSIDFNVFLKNAYLDAEDDSVGTETAGTGNEWFFNIIGTDNKGGGLGKSLFFFF